MTDSTQDLERRIKESAPSVRLLAENERLNKECSGLAANQCHCGYGDEHGNHRCEYQDEIEQLRALLQEALYIAEPNTERSIDAIFILSQRGWFDDVRTLLNSKDNKNG